MRFTLANQLLVCLCDVLVNIVVMFDRRTWCSVSSSFIGYLMNTTQTRIDSLLLLPLPNRSLPHS